MSWLSNHRRIHCLLNCCFQAQIKENIEAPRHWSLCGEFTGDRWIPRLKGQQRGKCFHLMTSSSLNKIYRVVIGRYCILCENFFYNISTKSSSHLQVSWSVSHLVTRSVSQWVSQQWVCFAVKNACLKQCRLFIKQQWSYILDCWPCQRIGDLISN